MNRESTSEVRLFLRVRVFSFVMIDRRLAGSIGLIFCVLCFVLVTIADFVSAIVYLRACSARARGKSFGFR